MPITLDVARTPMPLPTTVASGGSDDAAIAAGIRVELHQLMRPRVDAATVADDARTTPRVAPVPDRFVVGMRLPVTVTVYGHTAARAQRTAAGLIVAAVQPVRVGYLRTLSAQLTAARWPTVESVTASRVIRVTRNPYLPTQPFHTVAATVLLGVTVTAVDRNRAWIDAHRHLSAELRALRPSAVRLHVDALGRSWVRNVGPGPGRVARHGR